MTKLEEARGIINEADKELAQLFEKRMKACAMVADYKKEHGLSVKDEAREEQLIAKTRKYITDPEIEDYFVEFQRNMINLSCKYQTKIISGMKVAYSGVEGAYAFIAASKMFPGAELIAYPDFKAAYQAVENGECDTVVLPIENSYAGEVGAVMDLIFSGSLFINQVKDLAISHNLMVKPGTKIGDVQKVISHPQALDQCANWIQKHGLVGQSYVNTAVAAKFVKESDDPTIAAIASPETAEIFGLEILESSINDNPNNTTRFAAMSKVANKPAYSGVREDENFIIVFTVQHKAGALAQTLNIIGAHGYNMKCLRSRPMKELQWNYYFYIEAEGNINNENGEYMLRELSALCARLKLVGTFYTK